jgi:MFS transporter, DHA1 family, multidrug resistance protein
MLQIYLFAYLGFAMLLFIGNCLLGDPPQMTFFFILIALILGLTLAADPNSSSIALEYMGENAGLAASVYGTIFFFGGSAIGSMVSNKLEKGIFPLATAALVLSCISLLLVKTDRRKFNKIH